MILLDSYAVLALLRDEPAAAEVVDLVASELGAVLTAVGLAEVVDRLVRLDQVDDEEAVLDVAQLGLHEAIPLDPETALRAGLFRSRHYHRSTRAVSLADCVAAECARRLGIPLATSDPHLLDACSEEQVAVVVLPDNRGRRWDGPT
jgi:PIN domain nuclease of toxin-antitoxin system